MYFNILDIFNAKEPGHVILVMRSFMSDKRAIDKEKEVKGTRPYIGHLLVYWSIDISPIRRVKSPPIDQ